MDIQKEFSLRCTDLVKVFKTKDVNISRAVLKGVNLEVTEGEMVCILGSSGSGKTTLLKVIAGFLKPDAGTININHKVINNLNQKELENLWSNTITFVFQDPFENIYPNLTIRQNVLLACANTKRRKELSEYMIKSYMKELQFDKDINTPCFVLSGGELQRVALIFVLARRSRIILLDEPTGELDSKNTMNFLSMISSLCRKKNLIVILVSHNPVSLNYVDLAYSLVDGRLKKYIQEKSY